MRNNIPLFIIVGAIIVLIVFLIILSFMPQDNSSNNNNSGITTEFNIDREDGFKREVIEEGEGETLTKAGDTIRVHYTGTLLDGTKFDSSVDRNDPFIFDLGVGQVITGWDEGMAGLKIGSKVKLTLPPQYAYGERGAGELIGPNETLLFDVEILGIES